MERHSVIILPGLGDKTRGIELLTNHWKRHDLKPFVYSVHWRDNHDFQSKLDNLVILVDSLKGKKDKVSIVGTSAGGSAALNLFAGHSDMINKVANICGRLRIGPTSGFRSFESKTSTSSAFAESVKLCETKLVSFKVDERKRIMTVRAKFGDELVPPETVTVNGALNTEIPTIEHGFSIIMALTLFSKPIINFLKE